MKNLFLFLFIAFLTLTLSGLAQEKNGTTAEMNPIISNNISNQQITSFTEDAFGHIWISTIRGLNKFNVYEYHQYFKGDDSLSICDNRIQHLFKDSHKKLWVATVNGICRYNDRDCFDQIPLESPSQNAIRFFENNDGHLFVNLNFQICAYNQLKDKFIPVIDSLDNKNYFNNCIIDKSNNLWVVMQKEIRCYNSNTYKLKQKIKLDRYITFSYLNNNGELWLFSWNHIKIFDTLSGQYKQVPEAIAKNMLLKNATITHMHTYNNSSVLINTQKDGLFIYNHISGTLIHQSENGFPFKVPNFEITTFFTDSQKNLWIGSYDQGFTVRYSYKERFNNNNYLQSKLSNQSVLSVAPDRNKNLWIVTRSNGVQIYRNDNKQIQYIPQDVLSPSWSPSFQHKVKKVYIDNENNIWLLSDWLLLKAQYKQGRFEVKNNYYFPTGVLSITQDQKGTIWLGGANENIYIMRKGEKEFNLFPLYGKGFKFTTAIISHSSGKIIVATFDQELQMIDPYSWEVTTIPILDQIQSSKFVPTTLFEDSEGNVWIGTMNNGLFIYSTKNQTIEKLTGTACSDISSINEDLNGNIWIGTLYGLSKYDRTSKQFINYYETDGIGGNQFNEQSSCYFSDNNLIFGGTHGLTLFNPIDVNYNKSIPLLFEDLKIHNKLEHASQSNCIDKHLSYNPDITLKYHQNSFTISFAAIDYCEFERVNYSYKLEGFDKIWIDANNSREAYYSNIPAGKYTFKVKITNNENTITEAENAISVRLKPAPWFSWPAFILYLIIFEIIIVFIIRTHRRIKTNKKKILQTELEKEQEHKVNKMNMSFFANLSHEFRTPLTMITGPVSLLCDEDSIKGANKQLLYIVQRSVNRMLRLVNQLMDFNKLENDTLKLKVKLTDIITEINRPIEVFRLNAKEKGIELNTYGLEDNFVMWLDRDKLEKITANLISNALKFSSTGGKIDISFDVITCDEATKLFDIATEELPSSYVKISVADTGTGIPDDKLEKVFERYFQLSNQTKEFYNWGTGIGLYYARCLVELHHGYIKAANKPKGGAVFTFILPVSELVYTTEERSDETDLQQKHKFPVQTEEQFDLKDEISKVIDKKQKLMVIDDDTDIIHYLKSLFSPYYNVVCKFNADSAYESIKDEEPDLILCDVIMPGTNGFDFCRKVKENHYFCHLPVILVTAKATVENQVEGLNTGADAYVTKPFEPSYLLALIKSQLKNREKVQNLLANTTKTETIDKNILSLQDNSFMTNLYELMEHELSNSELNITRMTEVLKISRTKFYYKVKGLTGENPNVFFKKYKLNRAAELLIEGNHNISETADLTGFNTLSHFSVSFKKQFGVSPSDYKGML